MVGEGEHRHGSQCFGVLNKDAHQEHRDGVGEVWSETAKSMADNVPDSSVHGRATLCRRHGLKSFEGMLQVFLPTF